MSKAHRPLKDALAKLRTARSWTWSQVFAAKFALYRKDSFSADTSKFWSWTTQDRF